MTDDRAVVSTDVPRHEAAGNAAGRDGGAPLPAAVSVALPLGLWMLLLLWAIFPIPRCQELFDDLGVRLPVVTALILRGANVVRHWPAATLGAFVMLMALDVWFDRTLAAAARHSLRRRLLGVRVAVPLGLMVLAVWGMLAPLLQLRANLP